MDTSKRLYLVCKLGDPNRFVVRIVQGCGMLNERLWVGAIEMERESIDLSQVAKLILCYNCSDRTPYLAVGAPFHERLHPIKSCLIVCARWRYKVVSLVFERIYILFP